ncbi:MAG: glycosyltransferase [Minisyncoccota bacterium]
MEQGELKVLMISSDRKVLEEGSAVRERMKEYGQLVTELHIVLLSNVLKIENSKLKIAENTWVYPTNSSSKWFRSGGAVRLGKKIVFEKKFVRGKSLITTQDPFECGWAGLKVKNKWRIPLEVQLHTDPFSPYFSGFLNTVRKWMARRILTRADGIRVVSESLKSFLLSTYSLLPTTINVLPIFIDRERIENARVSFDLHARFGWHFILLSVARLTPEKNIPMILNVLKKIIEFFPTTGLVIVGAGPEEERLKQEARSKKLEANVAFVGWQEDLASYYKSANMFVQTSFFEGYGLALVEAGLSGLPIVTTAVGIANDLENGQDAYICPVGDTEYMFKAIYDLIENNPKRETLRLNIKHKLDSILITKEEYLVRLKKAWTETASKVHA